jgi:hypothetical protein
VLITAGTWFAGFQTSLFLDRLVVKPVLEANGATNVQFGNRGDDPLPLDPKADPRYSDAWNVWVRADWAGPNRFVDAEPFMAWIVKQGAVAPGSPPAAPSSPQAPSSGPPSSNALGLLLVLWIVSELD